MKEILQFRFVPGRGFFLDLVDAPSATRVTPNSGDVVLHEGNGSDRFDGVGISGGAVLGFDLLRIEAEPVVVVKFRRGSLTDTISLGTTSDVASAERWIDRVNTIYRERDQSNQAADAAPQAGKHSYSPVVNDILSTRQSFILPGDYIYSADQSPPEFPVGSSAPSAVPAWQHFYVARCLAGLKDYAGITGEIEEVWGRPPQHSYDWLSSRVRYSKATFRNRITQPLELIFDREDRRAFIGVVPFSSVSYFALMYYRDRAPQQHFKLRPDEPIAGSFGDFLEMLRHPASPGKQIAVCTPSNQSPDYSIRDAVRTGQLEEEQTESLPRVSHLARWLVDNYARGVVACDKGIAYQVVYAMRRDKFPGAEKVEFALVPYERAIRVGFCYRSDDPQWGIICANALADTFATKDEKVMESLEAFSRKARRIGVDFPVAA